MPITCKVDNTEFASRDDLHKYLRSIKLRQEDYYTQYESRTDKLTGEKIPFNRNVEKYLATEFLSKDNLRKWLSQNREEGPKWAVEWLRKRKEAKNLTQAPSHVELLSLLAPTKRYYGYIGGYAKICAEIGLECKLQLNSIAATEFPIGAKIIEDTREQKPIPLSVPVVHSKLNCGDYGLTAEFDNGIYLERKSLNDFISTLSDRSIERKTGTDSNLARIARELERAKEVGSYIVMIVEDPIEKALHFNEDYHFSRCRISPEHIFHNLRDLLHDFDNFQVLFLKNRDEMARAIVRLLSAGEVVKQVDLQYAYETGGLSL